MKIEHEQQKKKGAFFIEEGGERLSELRYFTSAPNVITVFHTEVSEKLRGKGIGQDLIAAVVNFARENKLKIKPACPYAKRVIDSIPEFKDILAG